jgi:hypothetical protein
MYYRKSSTKEYTCTTGRVQQRNTHVLQEEFNKGIHMYYRKSSTKEYTCTTGRVQPRNTHVLQEEFNQGIHICTTDSLVELFL